MSALGDWTLELNSVDYVCSNSPAASESKFAGKKRGLPKTHRLAVHKWPALPSLADAPKGITTPRLFKLPSGTISQSLLTSRAQSEATQMTTMLSYGRHLQPQSWICTSASPSRSPHQSRAKNYRFLLNARCNQRRCAEHFGRQIAGRQTFGP